MVVAFSHNFHSLVSPLLTRFLTSSHSSPYKTFHSLPLTLFYILFYLFSSICSTRGVILPIFITSLWSIYCLHVSVCRSCIILIITQKCKSHASKEESSHRNIPSSVIQFPFEGLRRLFDTCIFQIIISHFLNASLFRMFASDVIQIIKHYHLDKVVYYTHTMNLNCCTEFYNNLRQTWDAYSIKLVLTRGTLSFPWIFKEFLGSLPYHSSFVCYPSLLSLYLSLRGYYYWHPL